MSHVSRVAFTVLLSIALAVGCGDDTGTVLCPDIGVQDQAIKADAPPPDGPNPDMVAVDQLQPDQLAPDLLSPDTRSPDLVPVPDVNPWCGPGTSLCQGKCVDLQKDGANCGACGKACKAGEVCSAGKCAFVCPAGQAMCTAASGAPYCANLQSDNKDCGGCGKACAAAEACVAGKCTFTCPGNLTKCSPAGGSPYCAATDSDNKNCGACGKACAATEACVAGKCTLTCPPAQTKCAPAGGPAFCASTQSDNKNCGQCGFACKSNEVCTSGVCVPFCLPGQTQCKPAGGGAPYCANLQTDASDCGKCGAACAAPQKCLAGKCLAQSCVGLSSHWQLEEMAGTAANDSVGTNHGTLTGGPVWTSGKLGGALRFSGSNYVRIKDSADLDPRLGDFSVEAWILIPSGQKGQRRVVAHGTHGPKGHDGFALMEWCAWGKVPCGGVGLLMGQDGKGENLVGTCAAMDDGKWHHYAAVANRKGSMQFYVDGKLLTSPCYGLSGGHKWGNNKPGDISHLATVDLNSACSMCLGQACQSSGSCSGNAEYFKGSLDQVAFYKRALSSAEVAAHYNSGKGAELCKPAGAANGCADGTREGLVSQAAFPKIAACAGKWSGDVSGAGALCAQGWKPCLGVDASIKKVNYGQARAFGGCFAFDSAHDNNKCYSDCSAAVAKGVDNAKNIDMGGMGGACKYAYSSAGSCLASGRIDASTNSGTGCNYYSGLSGVICCAP